MAEYEYKVGDKVLRHDGCGEGFKVDTIERITPSGQLVIGPYKFRQNGNQIGGSTWHHQWVEPFDQEKVERQRLRDTGRINRRKIQETAWVSGWGPDALIQQIADLIDDQNAIYKAESDARKAARGE